MNADPEGEDSRWLIVEDGFSAALANTCWPGRHGVQLRSADLPDGFPASPAGVRCVHDGVQAASEREA